jgi:hypothetical protein
MDFYIVIVPALVLSLGMLLNLLILKRRDKYLFAELRHGLDVISVIRERWLNLSGEEYYQLRRLIEDTGEAAAPVHSLYHFILPEPKPHEKNTIEEQREVFSKS